MKDIMIWLVGHLADVLIYGSIGVIWLIAVVRCYFPVLRNTGALRHAANMLVESSKVKLSRPVWSDVSFLGKALQRDWRKYLHNAEMLDAHGQPCEVEDYINEDTVIFIPGNAAFADIVPGLCTSLGILGTFLGLAAGLNNINMHEMERAITQIVSGLALAFYTSIVGLVASMSFNILNKMVVGRARRVLGSFIDHFYRYGAPRPVDTANQLVSLQQEQVASLRVFQEDLGGHLATQIEQAVARALNPVAQSMDRFLEGTTRQQIEGVRHIVNQFVTAMDQALQGQLHNLGEALKDTVRQQQTLRTELMQAVEAVSRQSTGVTEMQRVSKEMIEQFDVYVEKLHQRGEQLETLQTGSSQLLANLHNASAEQAEYLSQLRVHQEALEKYLQDYNTWIRAFADTLGAHTQSQREALSVVASQMREGADLLQGSYNTFVENIQDGLAGALGMFDESMQNQTDRISSVLERLEQSASGMGKTRGEESLREDIRNLTHAVQGMNVLLSRRGQKEVV